MPMAKVAEKPLQGMRQLLTNQEGQVLFSYQDLLAMEKIGVISKSVLAP